MSKRNRPNGTVGLWVWLAIGLSACGSSVGGVPQDASNGGTANGGTANGGTANAAGAANAGAANAGAANAGTANAGAVPPSCFGMKADECQGNDCCASPMVAGGGFKLGGATGTSSATIASFALDEFEVTVARFRNFVSAYQGPPSPGAGAHPLIVGSGWQATWNASIAADKRLLANAVQCSPTFKTWSATLGTNDNLPINCVSWYEAFAFCAWDNGRLPTEAEWEYAAAGGVEEREYPWQTPALDNTLATAAYANYYGMGDGSAPGQIAFADILPVGSKPAGIGAYLQMDLVGSMAEWALDWSAAYSAVCDNCANLAAGTNRAVRGGSWYDPAPLPVARRVLNAPNTPDTRHNYLGFRCARSP